MYDANDWPQEKDHIGCVGIEWKHAHKFSNDPSTHTRSFPPSHSYKYYMYTIST
uniref:AlNc14C149G7459 protein n=1 Tax=Albugo laibachii Nc14 TaxID=890382 RepID=F0WLU6_9STRA|nr:AlNc14C149G7459 [Albugo laibachii Nc14]|eukprot:CCA22272.1 AlNc14C149G7459 [Albugo laibachii Nc14]